MKNESAHTFYSNGKLLITGEYLVLQGALALAIPTIRGQHLYVHEKQADGLLDWTANVCSRPWFHCSIDPATWKVRETDNSRIASKLVNLFAAASELKGESEWLHGISAVSEIGFDIEWGLGSSSSLISNIAWWAGLDPFELYRRVSSGSGYDLACARSDHPILYRTTGPVPDISETGFAPSFADKLAFVYLGRKQDSASSVKNFLNHARVKEKAISGISRISEQAARASTLEEYENLLVEHEKILSKILDRPPVKEVLFRDYPGMIKSLGAWGGDFIHVSTASDMESAGEYFRGKGLEIMIPFNDMIKSPPHAK